MTQELKTKRLLLSAPVARDAAFVRNLLSDPIVRRYLGGVATHINTDFSDNEEDTWIVHAGQTPIGMMSLGPHKDGMDWEVSYQFIPASWGKGYATEALGYILDYAFATRALPRVIAETQKANAKSVALLRRIQMVEIATLTRFGETQLIFAIERPE